MEISHHGVKARRVPVTSACDMTCYNEDESFDVLKQTTKRSTLGTVNSEMRLDPMTRKIIDKAAARS